MVKNMSKKSYIIILSVLVVILGIVIVLTIVNKKSDDPEVVFGPEALEYQKIYDLSLIEDDDENYYIIKGLTSSSGVSLRYIEFPSTIDGIKLKKIITNDNKFADYHNIQTIVIPQYIEYIGTDKNATGIGNCFFENASNLTSIEVDKNNEYFSSDDGVLFNKDKSILLKFPMDKTVSKNTFEISNTVVTIGEKAFLNVSSLKHISIGDKVETIEANAFDGCTNLEEVKFSENSSLKEIKAFSFQKNQNLTEVKLPDGLVTLGTGAFYNCTNLNSLFVPSSVVNFGLDICRLCSSNLMIYTTADNYEFLVTQADRFNNNDFASHIKVQ